jgi:hypothetical protein
MFHRSWAKCLSALAILAVTSIPAVAAPYVVNFEPGFEFAANGESYTENGIKFSPVGGDAMIDPSFCDPFLDEACALGNDTSFLTAFNGATVTVAREDAGVFSLTGFDASFFPTPYLDFLGETVRLLWTGTKLGGDTSSGQFNLLPVIDSRHYSFAAFSDAGMTQLTSLTFSACFFTDTNCSRVGGYLENAQFALDNLFFDDGNSTVPEPSMLLLVALGLASLTASRRRAAR